MPLLAHFVLFWSLSSSGIGLRDCVSVMLFRKATVAVDQNDLGPQGEIWPRKSDSGLSNYPSLGIRGFFVMFDKEFKMVVNKNLQDEIPHSVLKSVLQNQAAKELLLP